jgi:hypothetical protein
MSPARPSAARSWGILLYAASRRVPAASVLGCIFVATLSAWRLRLPVDGSPSLSDRSLLALSPLVLVVLLGATLGPALGEWEEARPGLLRRLRAVHGTAVMLACAVAVAPLPGTVNEGAIPVRNAFIFVGIACAWTTTFEPQLNWVLPVVLSAFAFFTGQRYATVDTLPPWLFLLAPGRPVLDAVGYVLGVGGVAAFVVRGPRRSLAPDEI